MITYGRITPIKAAIGQWAGEFYAQFSPDTPALNEWVARGLKTSIVWAPGRMVDQVEEMLSSWRRNDNIGAAGTSAFSPVMFVAVATEYTGSPGEVGRPLTDYMPFSFPLDTLKRSFRLRMSSVDLRAQIAIVAPEALSAMSVIAQLDAWTVERRTFKSTFPFAGFNTQWPVQVLGADRMAISTPLGEHVAILTLDLTLRAAMPFFYGPQGDEPNDGNSPDPGYPVIAEVTNRHDMTLGPPTGVTAEEWAAYARLTQAATGSGPAQIVLGALRERAA